MHLIRIGMSADAAAVQAAASGQLARRHFEESLRASRQTDVDGERDAALRAAALESLARSPFIAVRSIRCEARDGVLTLRGCVASFYLKQIALAAVCGLEQIREVRNEVAVASTPRRALLSLDEGPPVRPK